MEQAAWMALSRTLVSVVMDGKDSFAHKVSITQGYKIYLILYSVTMQ